MKVQRFKAVLARPEGIGTWTNLTVPFDTEREFGTRARIKVKVTLDGLPVRGTLLPTGEGGHILVVKKEIRDAIRKEAGDSVDVTMEEDIEPRSVKIPRDFRTAIDGDAKAKAAFQRMAYSHQKAYVDWIEQAKRRETRDTRIRGAITMISRRAKLR